MAGAPARTLVIDESLDKRLAVELARRGRPAKSVSSLGLRGSSDSDLLDRLDAQLGAWVLVTADDRMPEGQARALAAGNGAVATIGPRGDSAAWPLEAYRHEVVHRWAHAMHAQLPGTARRYGLTNQRAWRPRLGRSRGR